MESLRVLFADLSENSPPITRLTIEGGFHDNCIDVSFGNIPPYYYDARDNRIFAELFEESQTRIFEAIKNLPNLRQLELSKIKLKFDDIETMLSIFNNLTRLDIKRVKLSSELSESLVHNRTIESLGLYNFSVEDTDLFVNLLRHNSSLRRLTLSQVKDLNDESWSDISEALIQNSTLVEFCINGSRITKTGMEHLAKVILVNKTLRILNLKGNDLTDSQIKPLVSALALNPCLEELILSHNTCLSGKLGNALTTNTFLKRLDMSYIWFVESDLPKVAEIIRMASNLEVLNLDASLSSVWLSPKHVEIILKSICDNIGLVELYIRDIILDENSLSILEEELSENTTLTKIDINQGLPDSIIDRLKRNLYFRERWRPSLFSRLTDMMENVE